MKTRPERQIGVGKAVLRQYADAESASIVAPEVIKLERATFASDIWSLACTVVELLTGRPPYANLLAMTAMFKIVEDDMPPLPEFCSAELEDFLQLCFAKQPQDRPTAEMLFEHAWLRKHWQAHKQALRPQDSIPFIRRISSENPRRPGFRRDASTASDVPELDRSFSSPGNSSLLCDEPLSPLPRACDPVVVERDSPWSAARGASTDPDALVSDMLASEKSEQPREMAFSMPDAFVSAHAPSGQIVLNAAQQPFPRAQLPNAVPSGDGPDKATAHSFVKTIFSRGAATSQMQNDNITEPLLQNSAVEYAIRLSRSTLYSARTVASSVIPPARSLPYYHARIYKQRFIRYRDLHQCQSPGPPHRPC